MRVLPACKGFNPCQLEGSANFRGASGAPEWWQKIWWIFILQSWITDFTQKPKVSQLGNEFR